MVLLSTLEPGGIHHDVLDEVQEWLNSLGTPNLQQHQWDALVCWAYQAAMGQCHTIDAQNYKSCALIQHVLSGKYQLASGEFDQWSVLRGTYDKGLIYRRCRECVLFLTGSY
jgi:GH24 family phage-related lysozyme (muramidase)